IFPYRSTELRQILDRGCHARNILINEGSRLNFQGWSIGNEIFTECRQIAESRVASPQKTHMGSEYLVAGTDQVVTFPCLDVDGPVSRVLYGIEENLGARCVSDLRPRSHVHDCPESVRSCGACDQPSLRRKQFLKVFQV